MSARLSSVERITAPPETSEVLVASWRRPQKVSVPLKARCKAALTNPMLGVAVAAGIVYAVSEGFRARPAMLLLYCVYMFAIIIRIARRPEACPPEIAALLDWPQTVSQIPVRVRFKVGRSRYGTDIGLIRFQDGWLVVEGQKTDFALCARAVDKVTRPRILDFTFERISDVWTLRRAGGSKQSIVLIPFESMKFGDGVLSGFTAQLACELLSWRNAQPSHGISIFPPRTIDPRRVRFQKKYLLCCWATCLAAQFVETFAGRLAHNQPVAIIFLVVKICTLLQICWLYRWMHASKSLKELRSKWEVRPQKVGQKALTNDE